MGNNPPLSSMGPITIFTITIYHAPRAVFENLPRKRTNKSYCYLFSIKPCAQGNFKYLQNKYHSNYVTKACKEARCMDTFLCSMKGQKETRDFSNQMYVWTISCHLFIVINLIPNASRRVCLCSCVDVQRHKFMSLCNTSFEYFPL